jgi:hypothetical protein
MDWKVIFYQNKKNIKMEIKKSNMKKRANAFESFGPTLL